MPPPSRWDDQPCEHKVHQYVSSSSTPDAHTLETWTTASSPHSPETSPQYWVIYIHGGAWWRPMITSSSFSLTVENFLSHPNATSRIAGFASINYRLSTPPLLPQFTQFTEPDNPARNVKHPTHLNDVISALSYLQQTYHFVENYILVGHSCGATLAFQIPNGSGLSPPSGILGIEGIYDLGVLRDDYKHMAIYQYFTENAFGKDEDVWKQASPTTQKNEAGFAWQKAKVVALAHSDEDELVNMRQRDLMWEVVNSQSTAERKVELIGLVGKHDEIWREGDKETQMKVAIERVLGLLTTE